MEEHTTIIGRPTYMAMFTGLQEPGPILDALTGAGYPRDDISILLRPPDTDSVLDLLSDENAAGQDADVRAMLEKQQDKLQNAKTVVILHPAPQQVEAVRAALTGMGAEECDYSAETRYTGEDSAADAHRATLGSAGMANASTGKAAAAETAAGAPAAVDNNDLKAEIARLEEGVVHVKRELQQRDE